MHYVDHYVDTFLFDFLYLINIKIKAATFTLSTYIVQGRNRVQKTHDGCATFYTN